MQFHSTYLQRRQKGLSYREFQRLWRSHGDYAATVSAFWRNVDRYIHNDPVEDISGLPNVASLFDGVGELYYSSFEDWIGMRDVMWNEVAPDEKRVFDGPPLSVRGKRRVYQRPEGPYKLFTLAKLRANIAGDEIEHLIDAHISDTMRSGGFGHALRGCTVTTAMRPPPELAMDQVPQTASSHDILVVNHFHSEASARSALSSADYARLQVSENDFLDWNSRIAVLCRGWVLKGDLG